MSAQTGGPTLEKVILMTTRTVVQFSHLAIEEEARMQRALAMRSMMRAAGKWLRGRFHTTRAAELA
ncbi:hypothetical protein C8N42_11375 [Celeribacter persicus]|jgi:hypothetical protein|uniref:Uncharacterized protein n=2 Tax=Celeribacter persicus TaxID=1651082 RepID=A0A2T5HBL0_9RHOB|nr:hypothetical protein C8N42_11375 [Celeribacter persicus]